MGLLLLPSTSTSANDRLLVVLEAWRTLFRRECLWLGLALALCVILAVEWRGGADRRELWFWVASLLVVTGPMLVVSPVNARMFFSSYLFLCLASVLFRSAGQACGPSPSLNRAAAAAGEVLLVAVYACNAAVWVHRLDTARARTAGGSSLITLPLVPFPQFTA